MTHSNLNHRFQEQFGADADGTSMSPGRVNIIGEFTDYNGGFVLPCALDFFTAVTYKRRNDSKVRVISQDYPGEVEEFDLAEVIVPGDCQWGNYIRAMVYVMKSCDYPLKGMDMYITSDVPQGAGLSSSAALELAVAGAFNLSSQLGLTPVELAVLGQRAENEFMDCQCGIMDQLISALGQKDKSLLIDCEDLSTRAIAIPEDLSVVIVNSNYKRKLVDSEYNQRRSDCESAASVMGVSSLRHADLEQLESCKDGMTDNAYKRALHVITENNRTVEAAKALAENDMAALRQLMSASHHSLKHHFEVTVPATDGLVEICQQAVGDRGAVRMTGGGFGGAIVCLCRGEVVDAVLDAVEAQYHPRFGLRASVFVCQAGNGLRHVGMDKSVQ